MSAQAAAVILRMAGHRDSRKGLRTLLITLISILAAVIVLLAAVIDILTSPVELDGDMGAFQNTFSHLVAGEGAVANGAALTQEEIDTMVAAADTDDPGRQAILRTALKLVGRVPYFWGGKSASGWNREWNTLKQVTAPGVSSSGSLRPYGLDCSGFTDWVWRTAGFQSIGSGVHAQFWASTLIREDELQPGDLVFKNWPDNSIINHVGIYYGRDANGKNLYIHCSSGAGGVVINSYSGFKFWGRPAFTRQEASF